jgi:ESCRT-II complex subunit VPS36
MTSFSPFDCLVVADQTQAGLLQKESSEVDLLVVDNLELRSANTEAMVPLTAQHQIDSAKASSATWIDRTSHLSLQLTTHRIVFWTTADRTARFLHHSQVLNVCSETAYFKSPKILLTTAALGDLYLVFGRDKARLRDECLQSLEKALSRQEWEADHNKEQERLQQQRRPRRVGVDAVLTQSALRHKQAAKLTDTAFTGDADQLLREAKELVQVIHKYVATLDRQNETSRDGNDALVNMLEHMGMTSALSKADYKGREDAYICQVARELADFLRPKFSPTVPVLTLTDVYCLFNRARGSHLLSPEDLRAAAECCKDLKLGMSVATFPSGLTVLQDDTLADPEQMAKRLQTLLLALKQESLTALDVSRKWHVSAVLALEQLQAVERLGYLSRDETLETLRFFPNRFNEWIRKDE